MAEQESRDVSPLVNRFVSRLLRTPFHPLVSWSLMLITFTGRKSGKIYTTPLSYVRFDDLVLAFSKAKWTRNLAGGAPVTLLIKKKEYQGWAELVADDKQAVAEGLQAFLRHSRFDAKIHGVKYDSNGDPNWEDVQRAAQMTTMLRIQLKGAGDDNQ